MAYLVRRPGGSVQIRECVRGERGPRSRTLASFRGALDDRTLEQAERSATRPFDRDDLVARARALGIARASSENTAARQLVKRLRRGRRLDPVLVGLLRESLAELDEAELDEELDEAADWLGSSDAERSDALRGLLRLSDAIVQSRGVLPAPRREPYPEIESAPAGTA
jgi:hypothetical protein